MVQASAAQDASAIRMPSSTSSSVTVYGAEWCGACKVLERGLREKDIPFEVIDVDQSPEAYARARSASNASVIPITNVVRGDNATWVVGANIVAVERAYRGE